MFTAPSIVNDANYGRIVILQVLPYEGDQLVTFQNSQGLTVLGVFDLAGVAKGQPVRFQKNSSGLYEFDFPGAADDVFVIGPSLNVTPC